MKEQNVINQTLKQQMNQHVIQSYLESKKTIGVVTN